MFIILNKRNENNIVEQKNFDNIYDCCKCLNYILSEMRIEPNFQNIPDTATCPQKQKEAVSVLSWQSDKRMISLALKKETDPSIFKKDVQKFAKYFFIPEAEFSKINTENQKFTSLEYNFLTDLIFGKPLTNPYYFYITFLGFSERFFFTCFIHYLNKTLIVVEEPVKINLIKVLNNFCGLLPGCKIEQYQFLLLFYIKKKNLDLARLTYKNYSNLSIHL